MAVNRSLAQQQGEHSWAPGDQPNPDVLVAAAIAVVETIAARVIAQEQEEISDWRQRFLSTDSNQDGITMAADTMTMENEWREIHWQEPGISDSFGDGLWVGHEFRKVQPLDPTVAALIVLDAPNH